MTLSIESATVAAQNVPAVIAAREAMNEALAALRAAEQARLESARHATRMQELADIATNTYWSAVAAAQPEDALFVVLVEHNGRADNLGLVGAFNSALAHREACVWNEADAVAHMQEQQAYMDRMYPGKADRTQYRAVSVAAARVLLQRDQHRLAINTRDLDAGLLAR